MGIFFYNNLDLSERYLLELVPLCLLCLAIRSEQIMKLRSLMGLVLVVVGVAIFLNITQIKNRILRYTYYNAGRVEFLKNTTKDGEVIIFDANPLMEHCGPLYFDRIFMVRKQGEPLGSILETLKAKGIGRCYFWTMNSNLGRQNLADANYGVAEYRFLSQGGPMQFLFEIDLKGKKDFR